MSGDRGRGHRCRRGARGPGVELGISVIRQKEVGGGQTTVNHLKST